MTTNSSFKYIELKRKNPRGRVVYFHSYGAPSLAFALPELSLYLAGYSVRCYKFNDDILNVADPELLLRAVSEVTRDIQSWNKTNNYPLHGIGNSMGSFLLWCIALDVSLINLILNGTGSMAETIFTRPDTITSTRYRYTKLGVTLEDLKFAWGKYEIPESGENIKAKNILLTRSTSDNVIPVTSGDAYANSLRQSKAKVIERTDTRRHGMSIFANAYKIRKVLNFIRSTE
jgi:hypothetical protein